MHEKNSGDLTATGELRCAYRFGGDMQCSLPEGHDEDHYIVVPPLAPPESQPTLAA
jgi:hypothetical protein